MEMTSLTIWEVVREGPPFLYLNKSQFKWFEHLASKSPGYLLSEDLGHVPLGRGPCANQNYISQLVREFKVLACLLRLLPPQPI